MNNLLIILITLIFSAFFSGVEIAFVTANKLKVELDKGKGFLSANVIFRLFQNSSRFLGAMLLGNNLALVIYGLASAALLESILSKIFPVSLQSDVVIFLSQTIISALFILILAEFLPKVLFRIKPNGMLNFFAIPIFVSYLILYPLIYIFLGIAEFILTKLFGVRTRTQHYEFSAIDLNEYINRFLAPSARHNDEEQEVRMIHKVKDFHTLKLRECMVPRNEIVAIETSEPIGYLKDLFIETGHSKILVYQDSIDNIVGYSHLYDLFSDPPNVKTIIRPVEIFPETITADKVLNKLINVHRSVAVVVDEFGGTAGMATIEDLVEEIFGEIDDEFDVEELVEKKVSDNEYIFSGRLEVDVMNGKYQLRLPESDTYETLAGMINHYHQNIPVKDDVIEIGDYAFTILEATRNRVVKVRMNIKIS